MMSSAIRCKAPACYAAMVILCLASPAAQGQNSGWLLWDDQTGASDPDKPLRVHFRTPAQITPDTPVWFVMHGSGRTADNYRTYLADAPGAEDALILAPEFTKEDWPSSRSYNLGNISLSESNLTPRPEQDWAFSKIEPLFDYVTSTLAPVLTADSYSMYGHSAGAQFVHRYLMWEPDARVKLAVAANAGWYTLPVYATELDPGQSPDYSYEWPYSLSDTPDYDPATSPVDPFPQANLESFLAKPLVVLLGEEDVDRDSSLRQTAAADAQGLHRFDRGHYFFAAAQAEADRRGIPLNWVLDTVPGVGHSGRQMALAAAEFMQAAESTPGDFNGDGAVDSIDYAVWREGLGTEYVQQDFLDWRDNYGASPSGSAAEPIPTPAALPLAIIACLALFCRESGVSSVER